MSRFVFVVVILAILLPVGTAWSGECEEQFRKSGGVLSGTDFSSRVTIAELSVADGLGQMRGILIDEKMDVISEDVDSGSLLVEQRSSGATRAIPTLVTVTPKGSSALVEVTIKTEAGQLAKADSMRAYLCPLLARLAGGERGRSAAARGSQMQNNDDATLKDVYVFSREIAREAKGNALAVTARHTGRRYSLRGRVDYIQEDGTDYNVSFEVPDESRVLLRAIGDHEPRVGIACLFLANQLANVLTLRKGDKVTFSGSFLRYDDVKRNLWLQNCVPAKG